MPIRWLPHGDVLADADKGLVVPIIPTNAVGVHGAGLAKSAADRWPWWAEGYRTECALKPYYEGHVILHLGIPGGPPFVISAMTKTHWRDKSDIGAIDRIARQLATIAESGAIGRVPLGIPMLGAGLGGLSRDRVRQMLARWLDMDNMLAIIYAEEQNATRRQR